MEMGVGILLSLILMRFVLLVGVGCYCWFCQSADSPLEIEAGSFRWVKQTISLILLFGLFYANVWLSLGIFHDKVSLDPTIWLPAIITIHYTTRSIPLWLRIFVVSALLCAWVIVILSLYD
ncbi:MAG: hypothetical protein IKN71_07025 [Alphaproteobacteria bacterium]|nr:hypothetical protein [Alphaproteobacteria bacterium]